MNYCTEANTDILYILDRSRQKYEDLHLSEISILSYLALLMSIYDGCNSEKWGYTFSYNSLGGPYSYEILNEITVLEDKCLIEKTRDDDFYSITNKCSETMLSTIFSFNLFNWRIKYLSASIDACSTRTLPAVSRAIYEEPGLKRARKIGGKLSLHSSTNDSLYEYFGNLRQAVGDVRNEIIIPASIWIDYLTLESEKKRGDIHD